MSTYYSSLKFLNFSDQINAIDKGEIVAPVHIRVKPINLCNHNCWYCAYRTDNVTLGNDMNDRDQIPKEKMVELAHEFVDMGVKAVTFSGGGEPLLYKSLPEIIEILAQGGIRIASLTNGSNLKGKVADAFAKHGTWVRISIDAWDDESYVKSRGAKSNDFSKLIKNIKEFTGRDTQCVLGMSLIVGKDNHKHIAEVCVLLKECGVDHVKISGAVVSNNVIGNNAYHSLIKNEVAKQILEAKKLENSEFKILNHYHDLEERFEKNYSTCPFLQFLTVIGADQYIYTCQDKAYTESGKLGSIKDISFKEFWFSTENNVKSFSINPSIHCKHNCANHQKNKAITDFINIDTNHIVFT